MKLQSIISATLIFTVVTLTGALSASAGDVFSRSGKLFTVGARPSSIVATDLTDDGLPDLVTANVGNMTSPGEERPANDELSILVAGPDLLYSPLPPLRAGFAPYCVVAANMDALKAPDLVVANFMDVRNRDITLFRNMGDHLFEASEYKIPDDNLPYLRNMSSNDEPVFTKPGLTSLAVEDFNGDGYRDVIATGWSSDILVYFPGVADTLLGAPKFIRAQGGPREVVIADLDNDGKKDVAVTLYVTGEIMFWRGDAQGGLEPAGRMPSRGRLPSEIGIADFNRDGKMDIAVVHGHTDDSVVVFYGDGDFQFSVSQEILLGPDRDRLEYEIRDMVLDDFNGDGRTDIATACFAAKKVITLVNGGSSEGRLSVNFNRDEMEIQEGRPRALCVGDFNKDTGRDLAVALWDANAVTLFMGKPAPPKPAEKPEKPQGKRGTGNRVKTGN